MNTLPDSRTRYSRLTLAQLKAIRQKLKSGYKVLTAAEDSLDEKLTALEEANDTQSEEYQTTHTRYVNAMHAVNATIADLKAVQREKWWRRKKGYQIYSRAAAIEKGKKKFGPLFSLPEEWGMIGPVFRRKRYF